MRHLNLLFIAIACTVLFSCSQKEAQAVDDYKTFAAELEENYTTYSAADWETVGNKFQQFEMRFEKLNLTDEQKDEINQLRDKCMRFIVQGTIRSMQEATIGLLESDSTSTATH